MHRLVRHSLQTVMHSLQKANSPMRFLAVLGAVHDKTALAASLGSCAATAAAPVTVLLERVSIQSLQDHTKSPNLSN